MVRLGRSPVDLPNLDFQIGPGQAAGAEPAATSPVPPPLPVAPAAQPQIPVLKSLGPVAATAEQHNILGRQLTGAGRYREAVVEFTEALRLAPDFALALNARGYALVLLHDGARALPDLDQAIRLNPKYANAYRVRAAARKLIGDAAGAAADLERVQQLSVAR
jgi:tetratricopeptide (TPR) repeat protein